MARIANYAALLFAIAMFAIVQSLSGTAFAYLGDDHHTYASSTALTNPDLVCGDHKCAPGETPHNLPVVTPVKGIK